VSFPVPPIVSFNPNGTPTSVCHAADRICQGTRCPAFFPEMIEPTVQRADKARMVPTGKGWCLSIQAHADFVRSTRSMT